MLTWMKLNLGTKIAIIPAIAISAFLFHLGYSYFEQDKNADRMRAVKEMIFPLANESTLARANLERVVNDLASAVSAGDAEMLTSAEKGATELQERLVHMVAISQENEVIDQARVELNAYIKSAVDLSRGMVDGTIDYNILGDQVSLMQSNLETIRASLTRIKEDSVASFDQYIDDSLRHNDEQLLTGFAIAAVIIAIVSIVAWRIITGVTRNITRVAASLEDFATGKGQLSERIEYNSHDEIGRLVENFNRFVKHLYHSITEVVDTLGPLTRVSDKLDSSARSFIDLSERQNHSATSAAAATSSMVNGVQKISVTAENAAELAHEVGVVTQGGSTSMEQTVSFINGLANNVAEVITCMEALESETKNVAKIIQVISEIAGQTNLLAMNAAIEAARAGKEVSGFAVVAEEVRTLAFRTQESTEQIRGVIAELQKRTNQVTQTTEKSKESVQGVVDNARNTGEAFAKVNTQFQAVLEFSELIAQESSTQRGDALNVQDAIKEIHLQCESTIGGVREIADMSSSLVEISEKLRRVSSQFNIGETSNAA